MSRYYVTKKRVNMFDLFSMKRWVVRAGNGTCNLFVGNETTCQRVALELNKAFNDGRFSVEHERNVEALEAKRNYPDHTSGLTRVDWNHLSEKGLIRRINTEVLHPLGMAVYRDPESGVSGGALVTINGEPFHYADKVT